MLFMFTYTKPPSKQRKAPRELGVCHLTREARLRQWERWKDPKAELSMVSPAAMFTSMRAKPIVLQAKFRELQFTRVSGQVARTLYTRALLRGEIGNNHPRRRNDYTDAFTPEMARHEPPWHSMPMEQTPNPYLHGIAKVTPRGVAKKGCQGAHARRQPAKLAHRTRDWQLQDPRRFEPEETCWAPQLAAPMGLTSASTN